MGREERATKAETRPRQRILLVVSVSHDGYLDAMIDLPTDPAAPLNAGFRGRAHIESLREVLVSGQALLQVLVKNLPAGILAPDGRPS